jgi:hypothetical protein
MNSMKNPKWGKGFTHLKCTYSTFVVITQMPSDSNIFVIRTWNESKGFEPSIIQNQNPNSGKRPQNI